MPQKKIQDIVPSRRRSIREVPPQEERSSRAGKRDAAKAAVSAADRGVRVPIHREKPVERPEPRRSAPQKAREVPVQGKRWAVWVIGAVSCLVLSYGLSSLLARATVTVTPRSESTAVSGAYSAGAASGGVPYAAFSTTTVARMAVAASDGGHIQSYASGIATLVNASSPSQQTILAGTRLSDKRGLIYRTKAVVVIPASRFSNGKPVPSSVDVRITADQPGAAYNAALSDLSGDLAIVAFKGGPKAAIFYGRMKTDLAGGFVGTAKVVATSTLAAASASLSTALSAQALSALASIVPADSVLYNKAVSVSLSSTTVASLSSTTAEVSMRATAIAPVFKSADLGDLVARRQVADFSGVGYSLVGLDQLDFQPLSLTSAVLGKSGPFKFSLSGTVSVVARIDPSAIAAALKGQAVSAAPGIFGGFSSSISSARVDMTPAWIRTIPSSPSRISVVIQGGAGHGY